MIIKAIRIWELAHKGEFDDCSASLRQRRRSTTCHRKCGDARKEYNILLEFLCFDIISLFVSKVNGLDKKLLKENIAL